MLSILRFINIARWSPSRVPVIQYLVLNYVSLLHRVRRQCLPRVDQLSPANVLLCRRQVGVRGTAEFRFLFQNPKNQNSHKNILFIDRHISPFMKDV